VQNWFSPHIFQEARLLCRIASLNKLRIFFRKIGEKQFLVYWAKPTGPRLRTSVVSSSANTSAIE
jgi:hypothetical protein